MKSFKKTILPLAIFAATMVGCAGESGNNPIVATPPMGWNSFDSYGVYLYHDAAVSNMEVLASKYKEYGYNYFVIDAGWFSEYKVKPGTRVPDIEGVHSTDLNINEYGLLQPSQTNFPEGLKVLADRAHSLGLKFGIHLMRGIPRIAYERDTKVKGTEYTARDIADTTSICSWCPQNYGLKPEHPGSLAFYKSLVNQAASWGVDFIKIDDIVPFPREVDIFAEAVRSCDREIVLSLSPGDVADVDELDTFSRANMLRVTQDVWDDQESINSCFRVWRKWSGHSRENFFVDMDMIPFGELQILAPLPEGFTGKENRKDVIAATLRGEYEQKALFSGKGWHRRSEFTEDEHYQFITLRALSASPLFIGGDLVSMDDLSYSLLTNKDMLECNQNGVMGSLKYELGKIEVWSVENKREQGSGWIGVFNRDASAGQSIALTHDVLGLCAEAEYNLYDVWADESFEAGRRSEINPNGVIFIKYSKK